MYNVSQQKFIKKAVIVIVINPKKNITEKNVKEIKNKTKM